MRYHIIIRQSNNRTGEVNYFREEDKCPDIEYWERHYSEEYDPYSNIDKKDAVCVNVFTIEGGEP